MNGMTFYEMNGNHYFRTRSSLSAEKVKNDPAFAETMRYAGLMGQASKLASLVYQSLPASAREFPMYRQLTGKAMQLLKEGKEAAEILKILSPGT